MRKPSASLSGAAAVGLAVLLSIPQPAAGQATGASLAGRVLDEQGGGLPAATVTVKSASTGFTRSITTAADGTYRFASIPVDTYTVTAQLTGFKTVEQTGVELNVATTRTLNITMSLATATAAVTVTAEVPLVRSEPAIGAVVSEKELKSLPLNGRQFANVAVLAPGTSLAYNSDPTKPGQLTVALNGGIGRNVNYLTDGGDNTDDTIGGALQNFSLDSVQEFNIQTQQYKAEYGRSTGGVLTVVTKTGTNDFHGNGFGFFRGKSLNSETESEKRAGSGKNEYRRYQYGASLGGPIVQDQAHFFGAYERTERNTAYKDDFSFGREIAGQRHDFKVGLNFIHEPTLGGDFSVGVDAPLFKLKEDRVGSPVIEITRFGGFFQNQTPVNQYSAYIQDDWRPDSRLTVNVGVRYDLWLGYDLNQTSNPIWQTLSTQTKYNENYQIGLLVWLRS